MRDIEFDVAGDESLEGGFAVHEAAREAEEQAGPGSGQDEERVDEGIGFDEGSVQVDAERFDPGGFEIRLN